MFQPLLSREKIKKKSRFQLVFEHVISENFSCFDYYRFMIFLWLEIHGVFLTFFLLFYSVTSAVTTYNVAFFRPTTHDLSDSR